MRSRRPAAVAFVLVLALTVGATQIVQADSGRAVAAKKCKKKNRKHKRCRKSAPPTSVAPPTTTAPATTAPTTTAPTTTPQYTLNVATAGIGTGTVTSSPAGINCPGDCSETYPQGQPVDLTAVDGADSAFSGWSGDCTGSLACNVTMDAPKSVTATFGHGYALNLTIDASSDDGTVTSEPAGIDCTKSGSSVTGMCSHNFPDGTSVRLDPHPVVTVFEVWNWSGDCSALSTTASCTVSMTQTRNVTIKMFGT